MHISILIVSTFNFKPIVYRYIQGFKQGFDEQLLNRVQVFFMQSDGGLAHIDQFSGSKAILSGPAGGVVGYSITSIEYQRDHRRVKNP